ncbi:hypothetical protein ANN_20323 [Periplaneta americana]|uniref:Uncharacterized protein n=1 Tax=Periplaneta americana TaxID=6978 RepID=A0ABQ8SDF5_PERAM|nr:hypothetical protein ANN_20323 [Periplaneta americana]
MVGLCEGGNEPPGSLKASKKNDAETDQEEEKELFGSVTEKKLPRKGERKKGSAQKKISDARRHQDIWIICGDKEEDRK